MGLNETQKKQRSEFLEHNLNITEYSQRKPYVFISYASDNWETVFKNVIVPIQKQYGLRVYADKAFDKVNDKWIVPMLRNVRGADVIIAFVSQNYIESYACFLELLTAVNNKKQIVFVSHEDNLRLGDTTNQPSIERGVKNEILNQGANIATNTNNTSNDIMRAMKSAYTGISTLLEQDALSKYDISEAFINFFRDASINMKTINDLGAVKGTIESVSNSVFDKSLIYKPEKVPALETQAVPAYQTAEQYVPTEDNSAANPKIDFRSKKFRMIIAAASAVCCLAAIGTVIGVNLPRNVVHMPYSSDMLSISGEYFDITGTYTGKWKNGMPYKEGTFTFSCGDVYSGEWENGKANGQGTFIYVDNSGYAGEFKNGKFDGQGTATYADGAIYKGEFKDDLRSGQGTMTYADGGIYTGEWVNDKQEGHGIFTGSDGHTYDGEWKDGKKDGQGTLTYSDGSVYEGEFKNDAFNGQGTLTKTDGTVKSGTWQDGKFID